MKSIQPDCCFRLPLLYLYLVNDGCLSKETSISVLVVTKHEVRANVEWFLEFLACGMVYDKSTAWKPCQSIALDMKNDATQDHEPVCNLGAATD